MCGDPYNVYLLIWVAKLETSHVLQSNKNKSYRGRSDRLSVSIAPILLFIFFYLREPGLKNLNSLVFKWSRADYFGLDSKLVLASSGDLDSVISGSLPAKMITEAVLLKHFQTRVDVIINLYKKLRYATLKWVMHYDWLKRVMWLGTTNQSSVFQHSLARLL